MYRKLLLSAAIATIIAVSGVERASADVGDAIVGGIIGGVIVHEATKNRQKRTTKVYRAPAKSYARAEARQIQKALNYFGFPAGKPDGVLGRQSRTAISQYQAHMNYPVTGYLTEYEKSFLLNSHNRALAGGPLTHQQIAQTGMGPGGLLHAYRDEAAGVTSAAPATTLAATAPAGDALVIAEKEPGGASLPNFLGGGDGVSLASHCNTVSLLTNTNGGFTTLAAMDDPNTVLNEQFCLARTYAIADGEKLASSVKGVGVSEIAAQCKQFGPVMKDHVAALSLKSRDEVLQGVSGFVLSSGMAPPQLAATSKICLSVGYRTDDMDVAIGSGLILVALGEQVYAELMGHHLSQGFGATARQDLARQWYGMGIDAIEAGQPAVFAPGQPERAVLIKAAVNGPDNAMNAPVQPVSTLPTFKVTE
ncbi:MAG: peptidoglycan-binding protein [Silicimonas sp.]|nr:peptidoglycan-binding protein [Silicimonas sp.]